MAVLNGQRFIDEAIQSICDQTYTEHELVVVDDGSTDRTQRDRAKLSPTDWRSRMFAMSGPGDRSVDERRRSKRDRGLITFLDHDDLWFPQFLDTQLNTCWNILR